MGLSKAHAAESHPLRALVSVRAVAPKGQAPTQDCCALDIYRESNILNVAPLLPLPLQMAYIGTGARHFVTTPTTQ
jgi:hypothetical protein